MTSDLPAQRSAEEGWRSLLLLAAYRWAIAILLSGLFFGGKIESFLGGEIHEALFEQICVVYLFACVLATGAVLLRRPPLVTQVYLNAVLDLSALILLTYSGGGARSGLGILLIAPVAGLSMLLPRRTAILLGAVASLSLLVEEVFQRLYGEVQPATFTQSGMLGLVYFSAAWVGNALALRARTSEALAERQREALLDLSQINERIIQNIQMGVLVVEPDMRIRLINKAACALLDIRPGSVGKGLDEEVPTLARSMREWLKTFRDTEPVTLETEDRSLLAQFSLLGPAKGSPTLIFLEDAGRVGEQAQQMKLASLGRLTASIAHEIRNPLGAISHASQLLAESVDNTSQERRLLEIIHRHTSRINTIVVDTLGLSRRSQAVPETIRLRAWLRQIIAEYREPMRPPPTIDCELVSPATEVRVDPGHLRQILCNLWDNSLEHAGRPPDQVVIQMSAETWTESGRICLDIYDNGRGIPAEVAPHVFEPFYTTTRGGTGLGLYIARELCEVNHAKMSYVPGSTLGAYFRIVFANPAEWLAQESIASSVVTANQ